jgi:hypothetical protein
MLGREGRTELPRDVEQSLIVRHKDLQKIAELRDFGRRTDEILDWARRAIPDVDLETAFTQVLRDALADNSKPDYPYVFAL